MKVAPLVRAARRAGWALPWVHTGQHVDAALSDVFLRDLGLPRPAHHLAAGLGTPSRQTARILDRLAPVLERRRPDAVVVVGDVTSTLAAALCAAQAGVPVAHVEAGLRSFDESMPEERNRVLVDRLSARLYVTEPSGVENLRREGVPAARVRLVGNPMIDALRHAWPAILARAPAAPGGIVVTLHRPSNVDDPDRLRAWCDALGAVARLAPVTFPVHPRTRARLRALGLAALLARAGVTTTPPLAYLDFLARVARARLVLTDSGGLQEEAAFLGVPCLTLRTTTERPSTVESGANRLVGDDPARLLREVARALSAPPPRPQRGRLLDGRASERIVADLARWLV
jgi:UDP-N-acetylglucosamine 2-epimerase (non-hydrolysing)